MAYLYDNRCMKMNTSKDSTKCWPYLTILYNMSAWKDKEASVCVKKKEKRDDEEKKSMTQKRGRQSHL